MKPQRPVGRPLLREQIAEFLRGQIIQGTLLPGERLVESSIAKDLGVSQAPVREAVQSLVFDGLARVENHKGASVADLDLDDMREVFCVRSSIESLAVQRAVPRIDDAFLHSLRGKVDELHSAAELGDLVALVEADLDFHRAVIERSNHPLLLRLWDVTYLHTRRFIFTVHPGHFSLKEIARQHDPLLEALERRDSSAVNDVFTEHLEIVWQRMGKPLSGEDSAP